VHVAATRAVDVILLDFRLGDGTAADCLPRLRRLQPAAWIVVYTANRAAAESAFDRDTGRSNKPHPRGASSW